MSATVEPGSRVLSIDIIRGVAVMGIFSVNVIAFAMVPAAYFTPSIHGFDGAADRLLWLANFVLVDGKMRSLFSMLFGASMLLVADRAQASGQSGPLVHYRRMIVLLLFGCLHYYLLWFGDILTTYALVGMVAFLMWRLRARQLAALAAAAYLWAIAWGYIEAREFTHIMAVFHSGQGSPAELRGAREFAGFFAPNAAQIRHDFAAHASYGAFLREQFGPGLMGPIGQLEGIWPETFALMLTGMAAYRSGFLGGSWPLAAYRRVALLGIASGALFSAVIAAIVWRGGFQFPMTFIALEDWSVPIHPVMALGYAALIIIVARHRGWIADRFAAVGRAAFTNYLGSTVLATLVFNGWGLGLYGQLSRAEAWLLAPLFWLIMLAWSKPWLDHFAYGPFEWAWRSLSRGRPQPMRKRLPSTAIAAEA